jgi:hypothetical protein
MTTMKKIILGLATIFALNVNAKVIIRGELKPSGLKGSYYCQGTTGTCVEINDGAATSSGSHRVQLFNKDGVITQTFIAKNVEIISGAGKSTVTFEIIE